MDESDRWYVGDAVAAAAFKSGPKAAQAAKDAAVVATSSNLARSLTGSVSRKLGGKTSERLNLFDWIGDTPKATIQARTNDNDLTTELQAAIDEACASGYALDISDGLYNFGSSAGLTIWGPMAMRGIGRINGKWSTGSAAVDLVYTGDDSSPAILIAGTSDSANYAVEDVSLASIMLRPSTDGNGGDGILIDGSIVDDTSRNFVRNVQMRDVSIVGFGGYGINTKGNVFELKLYDLSLRNNRLGNLITQNANKLGGGTIGPKQFFLYNPFSWSYTGTWGLDLSGGQTYAIFGGLIQGQGSGLKAGPGTVDCGTHFEGENGTGSVGIQVRGTLGSNIMPADLAGWVTGLQIGDGTSSDVNNVRGYIPSITSCTTGVEITSGGVRQGFIGIGNNQATTPVVDSKGDGKFGLSTMSAGSTGQQQFSYGYISTALTADGQAVAGVGVLLGPTSTALTVNELQAGYPGQRIKVEGRGATLTFKHAATPALGGKPIRISTGADFTLANRKSAELYMAVQQTEWHLDVPAQS